MATYSLLTYFYFRRACSSHSIDGVCAVINNACGLLESDYCSVLRQQLRQGYPSGYLDLTQAYNALQSSFQQGKLQTSDSEQTRLMFLVSKTFLYAFFPFARRMVSWLLRICWNV